VVSPPTARRVSATADATGEEQQGVVGLLGLARPGLQMKPQFAAPARGFRPLPVDQLAPRNGDQPAPRIVGWVFRPATGGLDQRLLNGVLGRREVGSTTDEDTQSLWAELS
jgi:hypothetical protein